MGTVFVPDQMRDWSIEKEIGRGSYGKVYRASLKKDPETVCALKLVRIPAEDKDEVKKCLAEIQKMMLLKEVPTIVTVDDYAVQTVRDRTGEEWTVICIRMELLESLDAWMCEHEMSELQAIKLGIDIADALEHCRRVGIVHRDVKPGNLLVSGEGVFKLGDFGTASANSGLNRDLVGTRRYLAPESELRGESTHRSDIYSLGLILYELFNGYRMPFLDREKQLINKEERKEALERRMSGEKLPVPDCSGELAACILRACAYRPEDRYATAGRMAAALRRVLGTRIREDALAGRERRARTLKQAGKQKRRKYGRAAAVVFIGLMLLAGLKACRKAVSSKQSAEGEHIGPGIRISRFGANGSP